MQVGDYVWLGFQDGKPKDKLGGHAEGQFKVISRSTRTFVIKRGKVVERVNSDRVVKAPPLLTADQQDGHTATEATIGDKNLDGRAWSVDHIAEHRIDADGDLWFLVEWTGDFEPSWEPRTNVLEELVSRYFAKA